VVAVDDGEEQVFLAVDVVVEAALEESDPGRDVLDPGGGIALLVELLARGVDDLRPPFGMEGPPGSTAVAARTARFVLLGGQRHVFSASSGRGTDSPYKSPHLVTTAPSPGAIRVLDTIIQLIYPLPAV